MASSEIIAPKDRLGALRNRLVTWLTDAAYPLWARNGIDKQTGGFVEALRQDGAGLAHPRRARVPPRQIFAFAQAPALGWQADVHPVLRRGTQYFLTRYRRPDGLFRTLAGVDGAPLDEQALLYDQAFALLGFAAAAAALDARNEFEPRALELRAAIDSRFRAGNAAFRSGEAPDGVFESNPHMHLLEACLAWAETGKDPGWTDWVRQLVQLAMTRFAHPVTGAFGESFTADWRPAPGLAGRIIEPGHQFEWAWLLLRAESRCAGGLRETAARLISIGERWGVHHHVAINALLDDLSIHDRNARCWPQTERLRSALLAAQRLGDEKYWEMAATAAASLLPYLDTPCAGLWYDVQLPTGELVDSPAPASTFYHLVGAILALDTAMAGVGA